MQAKKVIYVTFIPVGAQLEFENALYVGISASKRGAESQHERNYTEARK
jgi:hypothetical protein